MKLSTHLIRLVLFAVVPVLLFSGVLVFIFHRQQIADHEKSLVEAAHALSLAVDRELTASIRTLQVLATSEHLTTGNLETFHEQSTQVLKAHAGWNAIVLVDPRGQQLSNTRTRFGAKLPRTGTPDMIEEIVRTGRPVVSNLFTGAVVKSPVIAIGVPVVRNGTTQYVLTSSTSPQFIARIQAEQKGRPDLRSVVIDRNKITLARVHEIEKYFGKPAGATLAAKSRETEAGFFYGTTLEGLPVASGFHRSQLSGWTVAVALPLAALNAPLHQSLINIGAGGTALLVLGLVFAMLAARRIQRPMAALAAAADAIGRGELPTIMPGAVAEIEKVARAFESAATKRQYAEAELRDSEQRFRTIFDQAAVGVAQIDSTTSRLQRVNEKYCRIMGYSVEELRQLDFMRLTHPDDLASDLAAMEQLKAGTLREFTVEKRLLRKDGSVVWVNLTVSPMWPVGAPPNSHIAVIEDVTLRKEAEQELHRVFDEIQQLHEIARSMLATGNLKTMAQTILAKALSLSAGDLGVVRLLDKSAGTVTIVASHGYRSVENIRRHEKFSFNHNGHSAAAPRPHRLRAFHLHQTHIVENIGQDNRMRTFKREGVTSVITIPVAVGGDLLGVLQIGSRVPRSFETRLVHLLETMAQDFGVAVQKSKLLEETLAAQEQLRELSRRLVDAQESERRYIAGELHDEIGSLLTGLKIMIGINDGAAMAQAQAVIDEALAKTRAMAQRLRPPMLDQLGLRPTLEWYAKEFTARTQIPVELKADGMNRRFGSEIEIAVFRIFQEALTNIARHARANNIVAQLVTTERTLHIVIRDNGTGFDTKTTLEKVSSSGLSGMRERVNAVRGDIQITSVTGGGTTVAVQIPLQDVNAKESELRA